MLRCSVTISLVPQIKGGPFVFTQDLAKSCKKAAEAGFQAVEILVGEAEALKEELLQTALSENNLQLAALGTGAGYVVYRRHLSSPSPEIRRKASEFVRNCVDLAAPFGAIVIIGSMQGRVESGIERPAAMVWLGEELRQLGKYAKERGIKIALEPLNRYETDLINRLAEGQEFIVSQRIEGVYLLADLFHMNIEEDSIVEALRRAGPYICHVHFVDSNRRAPGFGHLCFSDLAEVINSIGFDGFLSVEAMPFPDDMSAAKQTVRAFRQFFC